MSKELDDFLQKKLTDDFIDGLDREVRRGVAKGTILSGDGRPLLCPDCGSTAELKDSAIIYGRSFGWIWICPRHPACECFVGCHKDTKIALGTLANRATRNWRKTAHSVFDQLWKGGHCARHQAYKDLAAAMGVPSIHIGESDETRCRKIVAWARFQLAELRK